MLGRQPGRLLAVQAIDIHGSKFYDLTFALDAAPEKAHTSRIGQESVYAEPRPDDDVVLHLILGQVTKVEKR